MTEQFQVRLEKLEKIKALGINPYPTTFPTSGFSFGEIAERYGKKTEGELENLEEMSLAGRLLAIRRMGKSSFAHLFDGSNRLQIYVRKESMEEPGLEIFKLCDIGDIIGVTGKLFKTRTGELTVLVRKLAFLSKSFHPLPEKWHGLQDKELRFRQRYLDLIMNDDSRRILELRSEIVQAIRLFFYEHQYREVETPMMQPLAGGASARPFKTHHNALGIDLYLRVAPELYLKRLLVGGMEKIFEINRNFRNEGISQMHNPEFTMIEFYELYRDFNHYMELTEALFSALNRQFLPGDTLEYRGTAISLKPPFRRIKYLQAIIDHSPLTAEDLEDETKLSSFLTRKFPDQELPPTYGKMLEFLFDHYVEQKLIFPTFVTHYPTAISPLTKQTPDNPRETERFELYIAGMELANGFSELNDPLEQKTRFENQLRDRDRGDDEAQNMDLDFIRALEQGMPPAAGEGIGIDRLVMLYTGAESIKEVILFPLLKPKTADEI
jgi:lysyl-tRNA synthetase class 2